MHTKVLCEHRQRKLEILDFNMQGISVEEDEVGGTCGTDGKEEECV
jgi:hypothetical protein